MKRYFAAFVAASLSAGVAAPSGAQVNPNPGPGRPAPMVQNGRPGYTVASTCDLTQPLVTLDVIINNTTSAATPERTITVNDPYGRLSGQQSIAPIEPGGSLLLQIPLSANPASPRASLSGPIYVNAAIDGMAITQLYLFIPNALCAPVPAASGYRLPQYVPERPVKLQQHIPNVLVATPNPFMRRSATVKETKPQLPRLDPPENLRAVRSVSDCTAHEAATADGCTALIRTGALLLIWDFASNASPADGFRVYQNGGASPIATLHETRDTLDTVAKPAGRLRRQMLYRFRNAYAARVDTVQRVLRASELRGDDGRLVAARLIADVAPGGSGGACTMQIYNGSKA